MNRVTHFEIQADDIKRAMKFYEQVFGWNFVEWGNDESYFMIMTADKESKDPGINGGLLKRPAKTPPHEYGTNAFVCTVEVDNFDNSTDKILKAGGIVAMPKYALAGIAYQGYFIDTEGNTFGLHQADKNAK